MKILSIILIGIAAMFAIPKSANASTYKHGYRYVHHYGKYLAHRHWRHLNRRYAHRIKHFARHRSHLAIRSFEGHRGERSESVVSTYRRTAVHVGTAAQL